MATVSIEKRRKFRGKFLGEVNANNVDNFIKRHGIDNGTFKDLYVGDWFVSVIKTDRERIIPFRIADFDIYHGSNSTAAKQHHVCIVPDTIMLTESMYDYSEDFKSNGYGSSKTNQVAMSMINKAMENIFGKHLLRYTEMLSSSIDGDVEEYTVKGILMSEIELFGTHEYALKEETCFIIKQLALFTEKPDLVNPTDNWIWLRDISRYYSSGTFVGCYSDGSPGSSIAYNTIGVRPRFLLG